MMRRAWDRWRALARRTPLAIRFAIAISFVFAVLHLFGARDLVAVLSGTPGDGIAFSIAAPIGLGYLVAWLGLVLLVPILTMTGIAQLVVARLAK